MAAAVGVEAVVVVAATVEVAGVATPVMAVRVATAAALAAGGTMGVTAGAAAGVTVGVTVGVTAAVASATSSYRFEGPGGDVVNAAPRSLQSTRRGAGDALTA